MPKKSKKKAASRSSAGVRKRIRRSSEQIIADLQAEIQRVKNKAQAKELKQSPTVRAAVSAIRALDKGLSFAADENNPPLRHAIADARKVLGTQLEAMGMRLPKANMPKGPKPRGVG